MRHLVGARWDDESQNKKILEAKKNQLINYIEVNYPIATNEDPFSCELPIYAHSVYNGLCSAFGINENLVKIIKQEADQHKSPWIGEHLSWISPTKDKALGYVYNSIYTDEFLQVTVNNVNHLKSIYQTPVALELGPHYSIIGDGRNEVDFHLQVSEKTQCGIILDLTHLYISNYNLRRNLDYALDRYAQANVLEVHIAGFKHSQSTDVLHDCHDVVPNSDLISLLSSFSKNCKTLQAITFEHSSKASELDFFHTLEFIRKAVD